MCSSYYIYKQFNNVANMVSDIFALLEQLRHVSSSTSSPYQRDVWHFSSENSL